MTTFTYTNPTVGGSEDTWGTTLNANWDALGTFLGTLDSTELAVLDGLTASTAELNLLEGVTAATAELNILDGVTAATAELNYVDGVTSPIQTQLNAKASTNTQSTATWQAGTGTTQSIVSPANVKAAILALQSTYTQPTSAGAIGTYAWAAPLGATFALGSTRSGSTLIPGGFTHKPYTDAVAAASTYDSAALSGTWRAMGAVTQSGGADRYSATLWLRIS